MSLMFSHPNAIDYLIFVFGTINMLRISLLLIGSNFYSLKQHLDLKKPKFDKASLPHFSIIIPARNEEKTIVRALTSVTDATYPKFRKEIIVVVNGSTDNTKQLATMFRAKHQSEQITLLTVQQSGKANALNYAIQNHAKGELIMCLDADSAISQDALINAAVYFQNEKVQALCANVKIFPEKSLLNFIQQFEYLICYQMKRAHDFFNAEYIIGGIGSTFRRSMLEKIDFYDTNTVTEDIDLTMKLLSQGNVANRIVYGTRVIAYTESVHSLKSLIIQRFRWKWGRAQTFYKHHHLFYNFSPNFTRSLTMLQLPFAIYGDFAFLFEPLLVGYIIILSITYHDWISPVSAWLTVSSYFMLTILAEDTLPTRNKIFHIIIGPIVYVLFIVLNFVEYIALILTLFKIPKLRLSITNNLQSWHHVKRSGQSSLATLGSEIL